MIDFNKKLAEAVRKISRPPTPDSRIKWCKVGETCKAKGNTFNSYLIVSPATPSIASIFFFDFTTKESEKNGFTQLGTALLELYLGQKIEDPDNIMHAPGINMNRVTSFYQHNSCRLLVHPNSYKRWNDQCQAYRRDTFDSLGNANDRLFGMEFRLHEIGLTKVILEGPSELLVDIATPFLQS